jgi:hypothetical protein
MRRVLVVAAAIMAGLLLAATAVAGTGRAPADVREGPDEPHVLGDGVVDTPKEHADAQDEQAPVNGNRRGGHPGQHGPSEGHLPRSSRNVQLVGRLRFSDVVANRIGDVSAFGNYAYLNAQDDPDCRRGGVYVASIRDPRRPRQVDFLPSPSGSYSGEASQVISLSTPAFRGQVLVTNNEICDASRPTAVGGVTFWDVTRPTKARPLAVGVGDTSNPDGSTSRRAHQVHSARMWTTGDRAYAVIVDNEEIADVDILDITDPRNPRLIAETGLADWPDAQAPLANGEEPFLHDVEVRRLAGRWTMLLSYWDAGWVLLDVDDPARPTYLNDSDYPRPDSLSGLDEAEGNAHQAEWDRTGRFIIGTDEDFSPYRTILEISAGPAAGPYPSGEFGFAVPIATLPDRRLNGPTVYGGYGCPGGPPVPPPPTDLAAGEQAVLVLQRGPVQDPSTPQTACFFSEKIEAAQRAGYGGVIIANHHVGAGAGANPDAAICGSAGHQFTPTIPALCVGHRALHLLFGRAPEFSVPYPAGDPGDVEPNIGDVGAPVAATARFDGWGGVRLLDAATLDEIDAYAIPEALDERFATGYGDLSVHEVATDPDRSLAYLSWYAGGLRVLRFGRNGLREVGHYIDPQGNDFWGVEVHRYANGRKYVLASDRDSGLWIFRYTGP